MKTYNIEQLNEIIRLHGLFLKGEDGGECANLSGSDLRYSNLSGSNLSGSDLSGSDLSYSDLRYSNLRGSNLSGSDLSYSNLSGSDLSYSNLRGRDLRGSDLRGSDLSGSDLSYSDLRYSDLRGSNLSGSNLSGSDLSGSNLSGSDLRGAKDGAVCRMDFGGWSICIRSDKTSIGCQTHVNDEWLSWTPDDRAIALMDKDAPEWWKAHGDAIKAAIMCVMSLAKKEGQFLGKARKGGEGK